MAEQVYYDMTRPGRRLLQRARWTLLPHSLATCMKCGALAQWHYAPSGPRMDYCDDCVPRGCSCNVIDHTIPAETIIDPPEPKAWSLSGQITAVLNQSSTATIAGVSCPAASFGLIGGDGDSGRKADERVGGAYR